MISANALQTAQRAAEGSICASLTHASTEARSVFYSANVGTQPLELVISSPAEDLIGLLDHLSLYQDGLMRIQWWE